MHLNWKHPIGRVLASSVAAILATSSVYAIPKGPCDTKPDVCCEEPKPGPFAFAYPLDMNITCPRDFYVHVDGLAFQAKQDGMEFAINNSYGNSINGINNGEVIGFSNNHRDWDYNPGLRVGIGFYLDHDAWNVDFAWTWINITNYQSESADSANGILIPEFLVPQPNTGFDANLNTTNNTASASWKASYNVLDAKLAKPYYVSRYFIVSPHFGVRAAWIDQHFSAHYGGTFGSDNASGAIHHADNDLWSFGARTGLNTDWVIGKGWSLFGNVAASLLFGKFSINQDLHYGGDGSLGSGDGFDLDDDFYQNISNFEIALGLAWGQYFDKNKYRVGLKAAYEFHEWFDMNNIRKFFGPGPYYPNDRVARGNLTLNGFSLSLSLDM